MRVIGIETSCDETGVALYDGERGLIAHALYSQVALHQEYGGVVPELASRDHIRKTLPLLDQVLTEAGVGRRDIEGVAYTTGPGLIGALLVGAAIGRSLAWTLNVPAVAVHHMEGHLLAPMLEENPPAFPFVALLVSGGHTQLMRVDGVGRYALLGDALDAAAGDTLAINCRRALDETGLDRLVVAGGVGANRELRTRLQAMTAERGATVYYPRLEFCTDNGAMIAYAGYKSLRACGDGALGVTGRAGWG